MCGTSRRVGGLLMLVSVLFLLPSVLPRPFYEHGEPREALVPQAMLASGNWILPPRYGGEFAAKPPMAHWLMAAAGGLRGRLDESAARLPSMIISLAVVLGLYLFLLKRGAPPARAVLAPLILLGSLGWFRSSYSCRVDMVFSGFMTLGLLALCGWSERGLSGWPWPAIAGLTGAVLAKGPVAVVLPSVILAAHLALTGVAMLRSMGALLKVMLPVLSLAGAWYGAAYLQGGGAFLHLVMDENLGRFTGSMDAERAAHVHSAWQLYFSVLVGFIPWTLVAAADLAASAGALRAVWRRRRALWQSAAPWRAFKALTEYKRFSLICIAAFVVFHSIPAGKRGVYLLPIYPFISLLAADYFDWALQAGRQAFKRCARLLAGVVVLIYAAVGLVLSDLVPIAGLLRKESVVFDYHFYRAAVERALASSGRLCDAVLWLPLLVAVLILAAGRAWSARRWFYCAGGLYLLLLFTAYLIVQPEFARALSAKAFAEETARAAGAGAQVYSFAEKFYGVQFYLDREIAELKGAAPPPDQGFVIIKEAALKDLAQALGDGCSLKTAAQGLGGGRPRDKLNLIEFRCAPRP